MRALAATARRAALVVLAMLGASDAAVPAGPAAPHGGTAALVARNAWLRASPPGASVAAAYLTLEAGPRGARLVGASSPRAARVEIHATLESEGMHRMRPVDGVDVPARARVVLAPLGTHLMLIALDRPLLAGERVPLTLQLADGSRLTVQGEVLPVDAAPPGNDSHH